MIGFNFRQGKPGVIHYNQMSLSSITNIRNNSDILYKLSNYYICKYVNSYI